METTYEEFIRNILETRGRFACGEEYHERHHIIPRCMEGTNDKENLIDLFAKEHFEAHRLLALENPGNKGLVYAWWNMAHCGGGVSHKRYRCTPEEYEEARIKHGRAMSEMVSGENNPMYGKSHTDETKRKIGDANKGRIVSEEVKNKHRQYMQERWTSADYRLEQSQRMKEVNSRPEYKKKQIESHYGDKSWNALAVFNVDTYKVYGAATLARDDTGVDNSHILKCFKGIVELAGGYKWRYVYDYVCKDSTIIQGAITLGLITEEEVLEQLKQNKMI